jgi:hypothetical protein
MATKRQTKGSAAVVSEPDYSLPDDAPEWMKVGFREAQRLRKLGIVGPRDLAANHDYYIRKQRQRDVLRG